MAKKRTVAAAPCRCGERRIRTSVVEPYRFFWITFRPVTKVGRCLACRRIRIKEEAV